MLCFSCCRNPHLEPERNVATDGIPNISNQIKLLPRTSKDGLLSSSRAIQTNSPGYGRSDPLRDSQTHSSGDSRSDSSRGSQRHPRRDSQPDPSTDSGYIIMIYCAICKEAIAYFDLPEGKVMNPVDDEALNRGRKRLKGISTPSISFDESEITESNRASSSSTTSTKDETPSDNSPKELPLDTPGRQTPYPNSPVSSEGSNPIFRYPSD